MFAGHGGRGGYILNSKHTTEQHNNDDEHDSTDHDKTNNSNASSNNATMTSSSIATTTPTTITAAAAKLDVPGTGGGGGGSKTAVRVDACECRLCVSCCRLRQMQENVLGEDQSSPEAQRMLWEALKKSINGLINKVFAAHVWAGTRSLYVLCACVCVSAAPPCPHLFA